MSKNDLDTIFREIYTILFDEDIELSERKALKNLFRKLKTNVNKLIDENTNFRNEIIHHVNSMKKTIENYGGKL